MDTALTKIFLSSVILFVVLFMARCGSVNVSDLDPNDFTNVGSGNTCDEVTGSFTIAVMPIFVDQGCTASGCHGAGDAGGNLNLDENEEANGIAGVHATVTSTRVNTETPEESLILTKPLGLPSHQGGNIFQSVNNADYQTILCWIQRGAEDDSSNPPTPTPTPTGTPVVDCSGVANDSFNTNIIPIFDASCTDSACHDTTNPGGGLDLQTNGGEHAEASGTVILNDPEASPLLRKSLGLDGHEGDTIFSGVNDNDYKSIFCWIEDGALNN